MKPEALIKRLKKRHPVSEIVDYSDITHIAFVTSTDKGMVEHIWQLVPGQVWISGNKLACFVDPEGALESTKLDRYANPSPDDQVQIVKYNQPKDKK
jgi:hypothetical protein